MLPFPFCKEQKTCCSHLLDSIQSDTSFLITFTIVPMSFEFQSQGDNVQLLRRTQSQQYRSEQYSCKFNNALRSSISLCLFIFFTSHICSTIRAKVKICLAHNSRHILNRIVAYRTMPTILIIVIPLAVWSFFSFVWARL